MNKLFLFVFSLLLLFCSGCLEIPMGYTPDLDLTVCSPTRKYAITFSVDYISDGDQIIGLASNEKYIEWINAYLQSCGAFSSVGYKSFANKSNYHIHFLVHYSCMPSNEAAAIGFLMGYTFFTIPMWVNMYLDMSAVVYLNGKPIHSPSTTENLRCYVWLPFLPVGLVWNQWWAWTTQEKKCLRYLINDVLIYQGKIE